ncbi:MAG: UDP-N-acetylmuramoyl-L-alanine--D-glutamate ligase [Bacteroidetes bacterium]|nr:UDP-N-acetylmuramoyl-L-alanine--D-glutamate ligase [Bacteroidota bacterium]
MISQIIRKLEDKTVMVLGLGREGRSTLDFLLKYLPGLPVFLADRNPADGETLDKIFHLANISYRSGDHYLLDLEKTDLIIKSPGIPFKYLPGDIPLDKITSQTELFIEAFRDQVIGITGTKGKSTTSSLLHHIFIKAGRKSLLAGNIGIPPFLLLDDITPETLIVQELSSHQLQHIKVAPHQAVLLNIFQEHLDHYGNLEEYQLSKFNIAARQQRGDLLFYHLGDPVTQLLLQSYPVESELFPFSLVEKPETGCFCVNNQIAFRYRGEETVLMNSNTDRKLRGDHNLGNIMAASSAAFINGIPKEDIQLAVSSFQPLEHRLEYVGNYHNIMWYNDSISTIPESAIAAMQTLGDVYTIILGGLDRKIDYSVLTAYLSFSPVKVILVMGEAGRRIMKELKNSLRPNTIILEGIDFQEIVTLAIKHTPPGNICLLSPAAASYDWFKNFEERGKIFKDQIIRSC